MGLALRLAVASSALALAAVACVTSNDRNSRLGTGHDTCLDIGSDCTDSHQCCSAFCANKTCVRVDR
jgi:hypothetical protein